MSQVMFIFPVAFQQWWRSRVHSFIIDSKILVANPINSYYTSKTTLESLFSCFFSPQPVTIGVCFYQYNTREDGSYGAIFWFWYWFGLQNHIKEKDIVCSNTFGLINFAESERRRGFSQIKGNKGDSVNLIVSNWGGPAQLWTHGRMEGRVVAYGVEIVMYEALLGISENQKI